MTKKIANVVKAEINTLEAQGQALHLAWKRIVRAEKRQITEFDLPLGNLLIELQAEGEGRIAKSRLRDCNLHVICRRRRSEAKILAENWAEIEPMSKRFTSTSALLKAWKAEQKAKDEPKAEKVAEETTEGKKSDVGQNAKPSASKPMKADDVAVAVLDMLDANNISLDDFEKSFEAIKAILKTDAPKAQKKPSKKKKAA